jgi:uncharacterized protein (DUF927 family)
MKPDQIKRIAAAAESHGLAILERYLPGGKADHSKDYTVRNPHRADEHAGSLKINKHTGKGGDFAVDGLRFGDFVAVVAFAQQCSQGEAAVELARFIGMAVDQPPAVPAAKRSSAQEPRLTADTWLAIMPVPDDAPPPPAAHPQAGRPDVVHTYVDATGRPLFYIYRFNKSRTRPQKEFRQLVLCSSADGARAWRWKAPPAPRPLYGLDHLAVRPDADVVVHEGEKATDAARALLPELVHVTWPGGANAVNKIDLAPLAGRTVLFWPDNDDVGKMAMQEAAHRIEKAGAKRARVISLKHFSGNAVDKDGRLVARTKPLPKGWDAADALAEGWPAELLLPFLEEAAHESAPTSSVAINDRTPTLETPAAVDAENDDKTTGPFICDETGLYHVETDKEGKVRQTRISGPLNIPALARDADGAGWSIVCEFPDRDRQPRQEVIPVRLVIGDGTDGVKLLADRGLEIEPGRSRMDRLKEYIVRQQPQRRARLVPACGWVGTAYVFPERAIGETDETLIFQGSRRAERLFMTRGKLSEWQATTGRMATGNNRLMLALMIAFAGPLLKWTGLQNFIVHLGGDSSIGKSGAQCAAGSVWGSTETQKLSWRQTSNALESTLALHNDGLLILDELKEVDPKEFAGIIYMISSGRGKERAHHAGGLRETTMFRCPVLSSGEIGAADHLASAGQKRHAGQEVRFIEIPSDAGAGHGMWQELHGQTSGKEFTDYLKQAALRCYGTAGRAFVAALVKRPSEIQTRWDRHRRTFAKDWQPHEAGSQVQRVLDSFALLAFAGELAREFGIVEWPEGTATTAAGQLFLEWTRERPTLGNAEEIHILQHVRAVMERNWASRFVDWHRMTEGSGRLGSGYDAASNGDDTFSQSERAPDLSRMPAVHDSLGFRKPEVPFSQESPTYLFYITRQRFIEEFANKGGFKPKRVAAVLRARGVLRCDNDGATWRETLPNGDTRSYCIIGSKLWGLDV